MNRLTEIIEEALKDTKKGCDFKIAWIPRGWACVKIKKFSRELAKRLTTLS